MRKAADPHWQVSAGLTQYPAALARMEDHVAAMRAGDAGEWVWLVEHPPLYTAGTSARRQDLLTPDRFPVYDAGRGGQYTYHGPGQRVAYAMLDLNRRGRDLRRYINTLEDWIIATLQDFGVTGERREGRVGVWVAHPDGREDKIAAIGVRVKGWVTYHGISINVNPDLSHFTGIVPCGIAAHGVTSLHALGIGATMDDVDQALKAQFDRLFGPLQMTADTPQRAEPS